MHTRGGDQVRPMTERKGLNLILKEKNAFFVIWQNNPCMCVCVSHADSLPPINIRPRLIPPVVAQKVCNHCRVNALARKKDVMLPVRLERAVCL